MQTSKFVKGSERVKLFHSCKTVNLNNEIFTDTYTDALSHTLTHVYLVIRIMAILEIKRNTMTQMTFSS